MQRHDEETKEVVITIEDVKNTMDFFTHFKIDMPPELKSLLDRFSQDIKAVTFDDQKLFRVIIAHAMITADHPLVRDKAFEKIHEKCSKVWYDAQFDGDVQDLFSQPREKDTTQVVSKAE